MTARLNPDDTVGSIARDRPELLRVFDRLRIDYCCRGGDTLAEACRRAGVDVPALAEAASGAPSEPAATDTPAPRTMTEWCDHIEATHHAAAREAFARLSAMMPRAIDAHASRHPRLTELDRVLTGLREEMLDHMVREERVLFPWLRRLEQPGAIHFGPPWSVQRPIDCMKHDHDSVSEALTSVRALTDDYTPPAGVCATVRAIFETLKDLEADTRHHIHKENNILFPAATETERDLASDPRRRPEGGCADVSDSHSLAAPHGA